MKELSLLFSFILRHHYFRGCLKEIMALHVFKKNIGNLEPGVMVWVGEVRSYMNWSGDKCAFGGMLIITGSQEKYPAVNVIFAAEKHCSL